MLKVELLIFDLDGTLLDTRKDIAKAVNKALKIHSLPEVSLQDVTRGIGTGVRGLINSVAKTASESLQQMLVEEYKKIFLEQKDESTEVFSGVVETLASINKTKVILTNKSDLFTEPTLKRFHLEPYFDSWFSRESFVQGKPSPVPCIEICKKYGVRPEQAVMIGDTPIDLKAGQSAGVRTAAVLYGYTLAEQLIRYAPDIILTTLSDLGGAIL
ncbi:MAG: HAD family hydrolase [Proteobacteria bacterium]|nr:HAD family hydrolase [Pseudomonadota bacterium]NDC22991.1 HAD family hydrolase [Pseudomonadota bacterium]NDD03343.1 HAD family hydrolase [Pseudomonadota bacterium]NDG25564.1 HAD family hydrolase [Pseudomonadota bacterium]